RISRGRVVGLEDSGLRFHHLRERPVADAFAIRERASLPPEDELGLLLSAFDRREELRDESALPDAWNADERDELERTLLTCACERALQGFELAIAADERRATLRR